MKRHLPGSHPLRSSSNIPRQVFIIEFTEAVNFLQATHLQTLQIRNYDNTCHYRNYKQIKILAVSFVQTLPRDAIDYSPLIIKPDKDSVSRKTTVNVD